MLAEERERRARAGVEATCDEAVRVAQAKLKEQMGRMVANHRAMVQSLQDEVAASEREKVAMYQASDAVYYQEKTRLEREQVRRLCMGIR